MTFHEWAEAFAADWARSNPQLTTLSQYFSGVEQDTLDRRLALANAYGGVYGAAATRARAAAAQSGLDALRAFAPATLTPAQLLTQAILDWRLTDVIENARFAQQRFVFEQFFGLQVALVTFLATIHPIRNARDAENYLARLALVAGCLDEGIDEARAAAAAGVVPPRFILERTIEQLGGLIPQDASQHPLVSSFAERLSELGELSAQACGELVAAARAEVKDRTIPAFIRVRALLEEQLARARDDAGAWALPDGDAYYARQLVQNTGTTLSAQEIHDLGRREVERIEVEMDALLAELDCCNGTLLQRLDALNASLPPYGGDPRETILAQLTTIVEDARRRAQAVFNLQPRAPVIVQREPVFSEASAAAHYSSPAPDGSRPGIYFIPLATVSPNAPWLGTGMKSTAYHEAIPGHHFQITIEQESGELPYFFKRRVFGMESSFIEGWALYAERLADENGWYEDDRASRLGYLNMQLFRARRLVADTGLHAFKWTRQQAIDYGLPVSEVERYVAWPGQACAYMIGQLRILELREKAKAALGERFSLRDFHDLVLGGGTMPLDVLGRRVEAWIAAAR